MLEGLREAMEFLTDLKTEANKTEVLEINGKTYADKQLQRYDALPYATAMKVSTLSALVDYIATCSDEFRKDMIIHIASPTEVYLLSKLDSDRKRETLVSAKANVSEFEFDHWYDQERFMIEMQANFEDSEDRECILKMAGNIERKNEQSFTDNGTDQVVTMSVGVAAKRDVLVPNPVALAPYRTFQEVEQPVSEFIFRIGDKEQPNFKLVEAQNGIWRNEAIQSIREYLSGKLSQMPAETRNRITIIG